MGDEGDPEKTDVLMITETRFNSIVWDQYHEELADACRQVRVVHVLCSEAPEEGIQGVAEELRLRLLLQKTHLLPERYNAYLPVSQALPQYMCVFQFVCVCLPPGLTE